MNSATSVQPKDFRRRGHLSGKRSRACFASASAGLCLLAVITSGCVVNKQLVVKSTVFGFQVSASPYGGFIPTVQIGLVRNEYISNPTGTNITAAPLAITNQCNLTIGRQIASESISTR